MTEAVTAIAEAPLKLKDVSAGVAICSAMHQRYAEFAKDLVPVLGRVVTGPWPAGEEPPTAGRKRVTLRLLVELLLAGLYTTHNVLMHIIKQLSAADFSRSPDEAVAALSLVTALAKTGREELLGLPHSSPAAVPPDLGDRVAAGDAEATALAEALAEYNAELAERWTLAPEAQAQLRAPVEELFKAACAALQSAHEALTEVEKENERVLTRSGDLPEHLATAYEAQRTAFETLQRNTAALADVLEQPLPELHAAVTRMAPAAEGGEAPAPETANDSPFDDEESRAFYESLPDLRDVVPAVLLGKQGKEDEQAETGADATAATGGSGSDAGGGKQEAPCSGSSVEPGSGSSAGRGSGSSVERALEQLKIDSTRKGGGGDEDAAGADGGDGRRGLSDVLDRLPSCVSKELCDEVAVNFCYAGGASRNARRRMARALCQVPIGALQLLPYYSRVAAVLAPLFPDIVAAVVANLEAEFADLVAKKDATLRTLEPRVRNARYIAELLKFNIFPPGSAFSLLKSLLDDFFGHNVDAACALVEGAGRYLSRRPDTATRLNNMLDVMVKLKNAKNLDVRQGGLVDSAFYAVRVTVQKPKTKERPPTHEYIRHLIYARLDAASAAFVLKKLRRFKWSEDGDYIMRTILRAARKGRHSQLAPLASITAGLAKFHPSLGVAVVDSVLEEIAAGLENPEAGLYQRRVAAVRLLGELYAHKLANTGIVFNTLHTLLAFGHSADVPPEMARRLDPPQNFFRIRLVCALLEGCGSFFARGPARKRLEAFLPYLQRYVLSKPPMPLDVDLDLQELCSKLRLSLPKFESYEAACAAVAAAEAKAAAASSLQSIDEDDELEDDAEEEEDGAGSDSDGSETEAMEEGSSGEEEDSDSGTDSDTDSEDSEESDEEEDEDMGRGRNAHRTEAEEQFDRELAAAFGDASGGLRGPTPGLAHIGIGGPGLVTKAKAKEGGGGGGPVTETIGLRVMVRKGGRDGRSQELQIPVPVTVAQQLRDKEAAEAAERAEMKRMVLESNRREDQAEEAEFYATYARGGGRGGGPRASGYYSRGRGQRPGRG